MKNIKINLLPLFNLFTEKLGKNSIRSPFEMAFLFEDMIYATNRYICIRADKTLFSDLKGVDIDFEKNTKRDLNKVFCKTQSNSDLSISTDRLKEIIKQAKEIIKQAKEHQKQAHADVASMGDLKQNADKKNFIKIGEGFYKMEDITLLYQTAKFFNLQSFTQTYCATCEEDLTSLFDLGLVSIVTMFVQFGEGNLNENNILLRY